MKSRAVRILAGTGISLLAIGGLAAAAYRSYGPGTNDDRIARFQRRWRAFASPDLAPDIWRFVAKGVGITLQIALISIVLSLVFGVALALSRLARSEALPIPASPPVRMFVAAPATVLVQAIRASPLYMLILYTFIAAPKLGFDFGAKTAGIVALTLYTSCVLAEIVRAGILSLDTGQFEAANSLGLSYTKQLRFVILPQALRRMIPAVVNQLVTLIKDTSLLSFITVLEVNRRLNIISQQQYNPIETSLVAAAIYFCMNFALSTVARRIETSHRRVGGAAEANLQSLGSEDQTLIATARTRS